jgi:alpha-L-fucosidase
LQPKASIFSDAGPDLRWIGNEIGFADETFWSTIDAEKLVIGESDEKYLNTGDPYGKDWLVGICDVSIRPGWFYHQSEDNLVKSPQELVNLYYKSIGRNAVLLLNIPPDPNGLINENDIRSLKEFREILNETFKTNLALNGKATVTDYLTVSSKFSPDNILDDDDKTYWIADNGKLNATIEIKLDGEKEFDRIMIQEPIFLGQRIASFEIQILNKKNWETVASGTTIGYKRILRISPVKTERIKLVIKESFNSPAVSNVALYKASKKEIYNLN